MKKIHLITTGLFALSAISLYAGSAQENWSKDCAMCHGKDGSANTKIGQMLGAKDFTNPKVQASFTDTQAAEAIKNGIKEGSKTKMKAFGDKLSDQEIKELVAYVRSLKK